LSISEKIGLSPLEWLLLFVIGFIALVVLLLQMANPLLWIGLTLIGIPILVYILKDKFSISLFKESDLFGLFMGFSFLGGFGLLIYLGIATIFPNFGVNAYYLLKMGLTILGIVLFIAAIIWGFSWGAYGLGESHPGEPLLTILLLLGIICFVIGAVVM
jgi:hypothetical protein